MNMVVGWWLKSIVRLGSLNDALGRLAKQSSGKGRGEVVKANSPGGTALREQSAVQAVASLLPRRLQTASPLNGAVLCTGYSVLPSTRRCERGRTTRGAKVPSRLPRRVTGVRRGFYHTADSR
jgi:hypothetical protein